jgi:hypothetical protein
MGYCCLFSTFLQTTTTTATTGKRLAIRSSIIYEEFVIFIEHCIEWFV